MSGQDLSEFEQVRDSRTRRRCWFFNLDEEQQAKVTAARDQGFSCPVIATVIQGWGFEFTVAAVQRHFSGTCNCA